MAVKLFKRKLPPKATTSSLLNTTTIALDAMGGDRGPRVVIAAALRVLKKHDNLRIILVGDETIVAKRLKALKALGHPRIQIKHTTEIVEMDESPATALRGKKDSSMRVSINLVHEGIADACVSAGNTGALMATSRFVLKMMPGIDRPAIVSMMPSAGSIGSYILDLGANVDSTPEHLFQFAVMGSILANSVKNNSFSRVALLNIGEEDIKGNELVKQTSLLLSECEAINYIGFVESDQIFSHAADVIVCDGFVGNVALKSSEGVAKLINSIISAEFKKNVLTRCLAIIAFPVLRSIRKRLDPSRYNGATFLGLNGIVVKSHGGANVLGYEHAIEEAIMEVEKNVPEKIKAQLSSLLSANNS